MTWSENTRVGEFRLRERQFRGPTSSSWLAEAVTTGDPVRLASLEVPPSLEGMRESIVNAIRQALERGDRLREVGVVPGTLQVRERALTMVTPCPNGPTLREKMRTHWPEGLPLQLAVAASLANVVACAHEHDLTHGFLTPENVFLTPEGRVQVVEWGVHAPGIGSVWPGPAEGSPYWPRDPQIAADPVRRDLYALGVILYEILTGSTPLVDAAPGAGNRLAVALPEKLPRSLPPLIADAILQEKADKLVTARQLAVQLTFARSWVRAVSHGEPVPEPAEEAREEPATEASAAGAPLSPAVAAQPALQEARTPAAEEPRVVATDAAPSLPPRPLLLERLPVLAWWAGLGSGLLVAVALVGGLYVGLHLGMARGAAPESAVRGSFEITPRTLSPGAGVLTSGAPVRFDFEDGTTQGWRGRYAATLLQSTDETARDGERSLRVRLLKISPKNPGEVSVLPPSGLRPGARVRIYVLVPQRSMDGLTAKAFVQDATWFWTDGGITRLSPGVWVPLTVAVPDDARLPLNALGVRFEQWGEGLEWSGRVYVDAVGEINAE